MDQEELQIIINQHKIWLDSDGRDGKQANLKGADLARHDLSGVNFKKANLQNAMLTEANLEGINFESANLETSFLGRSNLQSATLVNTNFKQSDLRETILSAANLSKAKLKGANLWLSNLENAILISADLENTELREVNLEGADLTNSNLWESILQESNLKDANFTGCYLRRSNLQGTNLENTNFQNANLQDTDFFGANFKGTDLSYADLRRANLLQVKIDHDTIFDDAQFSFVIIDELSANNIPQEIQNLYRFSWDIRDKEGTPIAIETIISSVKFPPEYHMAAMEVLHYFGKVLQDKYPDSVHKFRVEQDGFRATMIIETTREDRKPIEKTLYDYKQVLSGMKPPEHFAENSLQLTEIKQLMTHLIEYQDRNKLFLQKVDDNFEKQQALLLPIIDQVADCRAIHPAIEASNEIKLEYLVLLPAKKTKTITGEQAEDLRTKKRRQNTSLFIDDERKEVYFKNNIIEEFHSQMYSLLLHFISNEGVGGEKEKIYREVWEDFSGAASIENINRAVDTAISRFREILKNNNICSIKIRKAGIYSSVKIYILSPLPEYCVLKKLN